jgi:hypothetical protein
VVGVASVAAAKNGVKNKMKNWTESAYPLGIDSCYNGISFVAFTDRVMIYAQLLGNQVDYPPLFGRKGSGEGQLIPHAIIFEEEDSGIDFQRGRIVKIQFVCRRLLRDTGGGGRRGLRGCRRG